MALEATHPRYEALRSLVVGLRHESPNVIEHEAAIFGRLRRRWRARRHLAKLHADSLVLATGGGSRGAARRGAVFVLTQDGRFMIKEESAEGLAQLRRIAADYADHVSKPSLLPRIVGAFTVDGSHWLVMNNVLYGPKFRARYDLKGSTAGRRASVGHSTGKDLDAVDDRGFPPPRHMLTLLDRDTAFLASRNLLDYSLLVGKAERRRSFLAPLRFLFFWRHRKAKRRGVLALPDGPRSFVVVGLIDILQPFNMRKKLEFLCRGALYGFDRISAVPPQRYRARFLAFLHGLFKKDEQGSQRHP